MEQEKSTRAVMEEKVLNTSKGMNAPAIYDTKPARPDFRLITYEEVEETDIVWLWEPYIQAGNISLLRGNPGSGKSYFMAAIMAAIANGYQPKGMPGKLYNRGGHCVYIGKEDEPGAFKKRIKRSGCVDMQKLHPFTGKISFRDIQDIREIIVQNNVDLIIFDPIQSYLGDKVDINNSPVMAPLLDDIREVARETKCAVLIVEHMNKNQKGDDLYRGIGSMAITGAARSVLMLDRDTDDKEIRYARMIKTNDKEGDAISFSIDDNGKFIWLGSVDDTEIGARKEVEGIPAARFVQAIMRKHPDGWGGTIKQLMEECPEVETAGGFDYKMAIGRELNNVDIREKIMQAYKIEIEINNTGNRKIYHFYKRQL